MAMTDSLESAERAVTDLVDIYVAETGSVPSWLSATHEAVIQARHGGHDDP